MTFMPLIILVILIIAFVSRNTNSGGSLPRRFQQLGNMRGRTYEEIVAAIGKPSAVSAGYNYTLVQWQSPGYHIAIKFVGGVFAGITHEWSR